MDDDIKEKEMRLYWRLLFEEKVFELICNAAGMADDERNEHLEVLKKFNLEVQHLFCSRCSAAGHSRFACPDLTAENKSTYYYPKTAEQRETWLAYQARRLGQVYRRGLSKSVPVPSASK